MNKDTAKAFANQKLQEWGLAQKGWKFSFNQAMGYAGICYEDRKEIKISEPICLIESEEFVTDTILHEIAHALAGNKQSHNNVWKRWARKVGCTPKATYNPSEIAEYARLKKAKYVMCFEGKVAHSYLRKPGKRTLAEIGTMWLRNQKELTEGKLYIEPYNPQVHTELMAVGN